MSLPMLPLLLITGMVSMVSSQCLQGASLNVSTETFPLTEDLLFVAPKRSLQYVIVPEMRFHCYGNVISWSALTVVDSTANFLSILDYWITFTLWRPNANKGYDLVGTSLVSFENLQVDPIDNFSGLAPQRLSYFRFVKRVPASSNLSFQPGDVIGWTIERTLEGLTSIIGPVSVVYRKATNQDQGSVDILYYSSSNDTRDTVCSIGHCEELTNESSVLPYLNIHYIETSPEQATSNNFNCNYRGEVCPIISTEPPPCAPTDCPTLPGNSTNKGGTVSNLPYIIGGTLGGFIFLTFSVTFMLAFLFLLKWKIDCRRKATSAHDPASANGSYSRNLNRRVETEKAQEL